MCINTSLLEWKHMFLDMNIHFVLLCLCVVIPHTAARKQCRARYPIQPTVSTTVQTPEYCRVNLNPGLPIEAAVCPESFADPNDFYISDFYKKIPRCFGLQPLSSNVTTPFDLIDVCKGKHPDAFPASIHSDDEFKFLYNRSMDGALIGMYIPAGKDFLLSNMINLDCTPVDYSPIHTLTTTATIKGFTMVSPNLNPVDVRDYAANGNAYVVCSTFATPRLPDYWKQPPPPMPDLSKYKCEGDGWQLASPCGGPPHCYRTVDIPSSPSNCYTYNYWAEFNRCGTVYENSFAASEHCEAEHQLLKTFPGLNGIGLFIEWRTFPSRYSSWQWADRTPFWWGHWDSFSPSSHTQSSMQTQISPSVDMIDVRQSQSRSVICKKPAITLSLPIAVPQFENFTYNGQTCRKEPPMHWNRRCPTDRDDWYIYESESGVFCYLSTTIGTQLTVNNFNHDICTRIHPKAKLGSIHDNTQLGLINHYMEPNIVVGMVYQNNSYVWADGTPVNKSFFVQFEPSLKSPTSVVKIMPQTYNRLCAKYKNFDCDGSTYDGYAGFKTYEMSTLPNNQQILCKMEAEPLVPCAPMPDTDGMDTLDNTVCDDGWQKKRVCGRVQCYKVTSIPGKYQSLEAGVENDMCSAMYPGSYLASIHCIEEHFYVQGLDGYILIGLHIPHDMPFDAKYFKWSDGTPVDFVGWNRYTDPFTDTRHQEPMMHGTPQYDYYGQSTRTVRNKNWEVLSGWTVKSLNEFQNALCKKRATRI